MNILIYSPLFYPSIGGLETVASILAHEFVAQRHQVKLITKTPSSYLNNFPFEVIRKPYYSKFLNLTDWCDIYFQTCISLKGIWPLVIHSRHWVVTHQTWYHRPNGNLSWQDYLKLFTTRFATNISVSQAIADHLPAPSTIIPNPYQTDIFRVIPEMQRNRELIFLGRLVSDKGADLLLEALGNLQKIGLTPKLTIVGIGPEEAKLRHQAVTLNISQQVDFVGVKVGTELAKTLNAHQILVVPSRWNEPFGIVALEGIACGCVVIGSAGGGLKEAIGSCGITFSNGNVTALTQILTKFLNSPEELSSYREKAQDHLSKHRPSTIARAYLKVFEETLNWT